MCGLKPIFWERFLRKKLSHPVWVCGLKPDDRKWGCRGNAVTPCMGVWIETYWCKLFYSYRSSHTLYGCVDWNYLRARLKYKAYLSHPVWVCGLKPVAGWYQVQSVRSHPVWVCGLKLVLFASTKQRPKSHPVWVCGLKLCVIVSLSTKTIVTPCMGVWIETSQRLRWLEAVLVTPCMGVWIETYKASPIGNGSSSHTLYGCVDWNLFGYP